MEFRIPANAKANMCLSSVLLRFMLKVPEHSGTLIVPENLLGAKQFSSVEIRLNGDAVSRRSCANEYFMGAYFQYITNMAADYAATSGMAYGVFDTYEFDRKAFTSDGKMAARVVSNRSGIMKDHAHEIVMPIEPSIFSSNKNLPTNTAIDISFERLNNKFSIVTNKDIDEIENIFTLEDPFLLVPFTNDLEMQQLEKQSISRPIKLKFDDYVINRFNIPKTYLIYDCQMLYLVPCQVNYSGVS